MMNLNQHKGIKWVVLILFTFVFLIPSTFAKNAPKTKNNTKKAVSCEKKFEEDQEVISVYGISLVQLDSPGYFKLTMDPNSNDSKLRNKRRAVTFSVTNIKGATIISDNKVLGYNKPLTIQGTEQVQELSIEFVGYIRDGDCTGKLTFSFSGAPQGNSIGFVGDEHETPSFSEPITTKSAIDCNNSYPEGSFESEFCIAKIAAQKTSVYKKGDKKKVNFTDKFKEGKMFSDIVGGGNELFSGNSFNGNTQYASFSCDYKKIYSAEDLEKNYYVNKDYLFGSGIDTEKAEYVYNYAPGNQKKESVSCKLKCEEAVTVEYGPPIASKAGLCFEYKIKVTSRVSCEMAEEIKKPETPDSYCTPTPFCLSPSGGAFNQGGPNEEFDQCIQTCDGGKYTDRCSEKCYKEVYGTSSSLLLNYSDKELVAEKMSNDSYNSLLKKCMKINKDGCYTVKGNTIYWAAGTQAWSRWHRSHSWGLPGYSYTQTVNGIPRAADCTDTCYWLWDRCDKNSYLNPGMAKIDQKSNEEAYNALVASCGAKARCNTSTAEFTIAVDYLHDTKDKKDEKTTIIFPYSTSATPEKDQLTSKGDGVSNPVNTSENENSTILGYAGCYSGQDPNTWYQTEWSFPGSWINNKTGEVSYKDKPSTAWKNMKDKFCIPLDAKDVNQDWWNYYYAHTLDLDKTSVSSTEYADKCAPSSRSNSITKPASANNIHVDDWNITGKTVSFGHFNWNLEFNCFYALNTNPANIATTSTSSSSLDKCVNDEPDYRIRPVDLNNMFPATDGTDVDNPPEKSGRAPGFNWTKFADNTKNEQFVSYPAKYMEQVQKTGYGIYSDNYLDYEFELTPDVLRRMRQTTKESNANYTLFSGESSIGEDGVVHYRSSAIREGMGAKHIPGEKGRLCNNMVNYAIDQCMSHDAG